MSPRDRIPGLTPYRRRSPESEAMLDAIGPSSQGQEFYDRFMSCVADELVAWLLARHDRYPLRKAA
jgi:hypothetical protein